MQPKWRKKDQKWGVRKWQFFITLSTECNLKRKGGQKKLNLEDIIHGWSLGKFKFCKFRGNSNFFPILTVNVLQPNLKYFFHIALSEFGTILSRFFWRIKLNYEMKLPLIICEIKTFELQVGWIRLFII